MVTKLTIKEAIELAEEIERGGGSAASLRAAIAVVGEDRRYTDSRFAIPATGSISDEEYLEEKRSQSQVEYGTDLECLICHGKFDHLVSGTCETCFREWMLTTKPKG